MSAVAAPELVAPAYVTHPEFDYTSGPEVADLAATCGLVLDPEQRLALDLMFAEKPDRSWAAFEWAVVCARQNMKTALLQAATLGDLFLFDAGLVVWTAHLFDTAQEAFRDLDALIGANDALSRRVLRVSRANGDEGFELKSGSRLKFKARSKTGGRGLTGDVVVLDEAFALAPSEMGALLPTLSAVANPQVRYASSAGLESSAILRGIRDRGRVGDPALAYLEWCAPEGCALEDCDHGLGRPGCALDDPEKWRLANPAMDRRISRDHIANERRALSLEPEEFARERLGWWSQPGMAAMPYPPSAWKALTEVGSVPAPGAEPWFALDVNPSRTRAAIAGCARREDGLGHVELQEYQNGTAGIVASAAELCRKHDSRLVVLADGAAASLIPDLEDADIKVEKYSSADFAAACGLFGDGITEKLFRHIGQEQVSDAVEMARKRERDGVWTLTRKGGDIAPLVACLLAYHAWVVDQSNYDVSDSIF